METAQELFNTPLVDEHIALNAKMVGFGGWNMPLQYESILTEWEYNRKTCSIFDCSHMGEFIIKGDAIKSGLDRIVTQPLVDMPLKSCRYGAMLNEQGGVMDDLIVYRIAQEEWMIVVNASNIAKDAANFRKYLTKEATFSDVSTQTAKLDLQGPLSREILAALVPGINQLAYYTFDQFELLGEKCIISRTGYTGELGFEIYYPAENAKKIWQTLLKNDRVKPTGLGVRDVLRIEMCYALYGHELDEHLSPLEAGLTRFIDFNKDFIGKQALLAEQSVGVKRSQCFVLSANRKSPRQGHQIFTPDGKSIGTITSGSFAPGTQSGVGIGFIEKSMNLIGSSVMFGDGKNLAAGVLVKRPFYTQGSLKN